MICFDTIRIDISTESELRVRLAARKLPFIQYQQLSEWLGIYKYIIPIDRSDPLITVELNCTDLDNLMSLYLWLRDIEATLTKEEHVCLARSTLVSEIYPIQVC